MLPPYIFTPSLDPILNRYMTHVTSISSTLSNFYYLSSTKVENIELCKAMYVFKIVFDTVFTHFTQIQLQSLKKKEKDNTIGI